MSLMSRIFKRTLKPDIYLDIARTSELVMVVNHHTYDTKKRLQIETYTFSHADLDLKKHAPIKKLLTTGTVYGVTHPEWITHYIVPEQLTKTYGEKSGAEFLIHQEKLAASPTNDFYLTSSFRMDLINQSVERYKKMGITIDHIISPVQIGNVSVDKPTYSVWIDQSHSFVCWHVGNQILYSKGFSIGIRDLVSVIADTVSIDTTAAQKIIDKYGIAKHHPEQSVIGKLYAVLQPIASMITVWEDDHKQYTYLKHQYHTPTTVHLYGPGADLLGIEQFFTLTTGKITENNHDQFLDNVVSQLPTKASLVDYAPLIYTINEESNI